MAIRLQQTDGDNNDRVDVPAFGDRFCNQMARIRDIAETDRERALVEMLRGLTELSDLALYMRKQAELLIHEVHENLDGKDNE